MEPGLTLPLGYAEHAPGPDLAPHVMCFWTRLAPQPASQERPYRVLPDGCVDFIVNFGPWGREPRAVAGAIAVGAMTRPIIIPAGGPRLSIGVRFRPGRAFAVFGIPASEATDETLPLAALARESEALEGELSALASDRARLVAFAAFVRRRLAGAPETPAGVREAIARIEHAQGNLRVGELADDLGITRQQLARQFAQHVGVTPKLLARVQRAWALLARVDAARDAYPRAIDWSRAAYDLGYYDQPHMIDDFKELTGTTPTEWLAQ